MFRCWRNLEPLERFKWGQKGASLAHSAIMALVGMSIIVFGDWKRDELVTGRDDRVAAFLGLEIGYLLQVLHRVLEAENFGVLETWYQAPSYRIQDFFPPCLQSNFISHQPVNCCLIFND